MRANNGNHVMICNFVQKQRTVNGEYNEVHFYLILIMISKSL